MAQAEARHILVDSGRALRRAQNPDRGVVLISPRVAKEHSSCPSSANGGELGSFGPGQMVPEFDQVVFSAPVNEVQGPVKTQFGYHLLEVTSPHRLIVWLREAAEFRG